MPAEFGREQLLDAFDEIGRAAIVAGTRLDIAVYGGSALMLAGNFRFATADVDVAQIVEPWPQWLSEVVSRIGLENGWTEAWFNEAVAAFLSPLADPIRDLIAFGSFPRASDAIGVTVIVPSAEYMLALKLMALRVSDFEKGKRDMDDVANLLCILGITAVEPAIGILARYFPKSAANADKQRFVLRHVLSQGSPSHAPRYPRRGG
jgi:hypothetical protein